MNAQRRRRAGRINRAEQRDRAARRDLVPSDKTLWLDELPDEGRQALMLAAEKLAKGEPVVFLRGESDPDATGEVSNAEQG